MSSQPANSGHSLNEFQERRLRVTCQQIDKLLSTVEEVLNQASTKAAFPKYNSEIPSAQRRTIEGYVARIRAQLLRILEGQNIAKQAPTMSPTHAIHVALTFIEIAAEELYPKYMRGYGEVPEKAVTDLNGICGELLGLIRKLDQFVFQGAGDELQQRIQRLEKTENELALLETIEPIVSRRGMVEFRSTIANILDRAEDKSFEIAIFGRVSSGKSSLLNAILGTAALPVGVTPITAVPTRIVHGAVESMTVWFGDRPSQTLELAQLPEFVTEQRNPGNEKHVSRVVVQLPAARLREGVSFVDTPGLGSLATKGAAETFAYLPKCDLGIVLIDAGSPLTVDDIQTILTLNEAAIPAKVLLSKADLLGEGDLERVIAYVKEQISSELRLDLEVHPVSILPLHVATLNRWFEDAIQPLYDRCRELRAISLKRKIGALRESVVASLDARLGRSSGPGAVSPEQIREAESRLRESTGKIEIIEAKFETEMETMSGKMQDAIGMAAKDLIALWSGGKGSELLPTTVARSSIVAAIQETVQEWRKRMESLARELSLDLSVSAALLEIPDKPGEDEFLTVVRGLPVFDMPEMEVSVSRPAMFSVLGTNIAKSRVMRKLYGQIGEQLAAGLETYAGLLRKWGKNVLKQLKAGFNAYADIYRAQAEGLEEAQNPTGEDEQQIREDLRLLGARDFGAHPISLVGAGRSGARTPED